MTDETKEEEVQTVFTINGKTVDVAKALPLQIKDLKALKKNGVDIIKWGKDTELELEQMTEMVRHVLNKANPEITEEDVDTIEVTDLILIFGIANNKRTGDIEPGDPT